MSASARSASDGLPPVLAAGLRLPDLVLDVDRRRLVRFAGAVDDYAEPHWDHLYMAERGFPGVIVHGWLTFSVLARLAGRWFPQERADYRRLAIRYLRPSFPGDARYCATIAAIEGESGGQRVRLDLWAEDMGGRRLAEGTAELVIPADLPAQAAPTP